MDSSAQETRNKLEKFANQLRKLTFPTSPISIDLAKFVASALDRYLSDGEKSLDAAFGLTPRRGAPRRKDDEHEALARRVFAMRDEKSWQEIFDILSSEGCAVTDERTIERIYDNFRVRLLQEKIEEEWDSE